VKNINIELNKNVIVPRSSTILIIVRINLCYLTDVIHFFQRIFLMFSSVDDVNLNGACEGSSSSYQKSGFIHQYITIIN